MHSHPHGNASVWETFAASLSKAPHCADDLSRGIYRQPKHIALRHRHIEINRESAAFWLTFDIDRPDAVDAWDEAKLPPPNFIAINPANGRGHGAVRLATEVARHDTANPKPLAYLAAVQRGMTKRLRADPGYAGFLVKNPVHSDWRTLWLAPQPYTLAGLAAWLDPADMRAMPRLELEFGLGRNVTLFDAVRVRAYRMVDSFRDAGDRNGFLAEVLAIAVECNAILPQRGSGERAQHLQMDLGTLRSRHSAQQSSLLRIPRRPWPSLWSHPGSACPCTTASPQASSI